MLHIIIIQWFFFYYAHDFIYSPSEQLQLKILWASEYNLRTYTHRSTKLHEIDDLTCNYSYMHTLCNLCWSTLEFHIMKPWERRSIRDLSMPPKERGGEADVVFLLLVSFFTWSVTIEPISLFTELLKYSTSTSFPDMSFT